ncbi:MAG: fumarylacetoacetate hydrolase [Candidatus Solibacter sp.]|nr:fumarylacetoacetate hydrolase [Candidatus Solibacter sp.]
MTDFPIQNLPYGVFRNGDGPVSIGIAIEDFILDLRVTATAGSLKSLPPETRRACAAESLNALMALTPAHWRELRARIVDLLSGEPYLVPMKDAVMLPPAVIGDYTDFYASIFHATNVGSLFRPDNPLLPNYKYVPIGYHGRASSIVLSGAAIRRPAGQAQDPGATTPRFGPTRALDYELEAGFFIGTGNALGEAVPIESAEDQVFGMCLVNDWSARDIQAWEYQPLGPFLGKSFATTISPWVVTMEALELYRAPLYQRPEGDPAPLPYLDSARNRVRGAIDLTLEVEITSAQMRARDMAPFRLSRGNLKDLYWSVAQMVAHHTSNGCNLRPGDLLASGTVSGLSAESRGCLLEITRRGADPVALPTGELRKFLEDGDEITLRGYCERAGLPRIGLGTCSGTIALG